MIDSKTRNRIHRGLRDLIDLDGGRRDASGILVRAASLIREVLDVPTAFAAFAGESTRLIARARPDVAVPRTEPWEGPGNLGLAAMENQEALFWKAGEALEEPSPHDRAGCAELGWWLGIPFRLPLPAKGLLAIMGPPEESPPADASEIAETVAGFVDVALGNLLTYQRAEALALTDELTRLYNFRFLKTALKREMERAARYGQVFSIIMIDVDHLKRYNDQYGHLGGSELLRQLAGILSRNSRAIDLVAKYGGDEFMIILPQTRLDGAVNMAQRLREAVAETRFPHLAPGDLTISVGVASFPRHGDSVQSLVAAADAALFRAKRNHRNCVVAADAPGEPPARDAA